MNIIQMVSHTRKPAYIKPLKIYETKKELRRT